jgi:hypothetical protein
MERVQRKDFNIALGPLSLWPAMPFKNVHTGNSKFDAGVYVSYSKFDI